MDLVEMMFSYDLVEKNGEWLAYITMFAPGVVNRQYTKSFPTKEAATTAMEAFRVHIRIEHNKLVARN